MLLVRAQVIGLVFKNTFKTFCSLSNCFSYDYSFIMTFYRIMANSLLWESQLKILLSMH